METRESKYNLIEIIQMRRHRITAFVLGVALMGLPHLIVSAVPFVSALFTLLAIVCIGYAIGFREQTQPDQTAGHLLLFSAILVLFESLRLFLPDAAGYVLALFFSIPVAAATALSGYKLLTASKSKKAKTLLMFTLFLVFVSGSPGIWVFTGMVLLASLPCRWALAFNRKQLQKSVLIGTALLFGWIAVVSMHSGHLLDTARYNFLHTGMYSLGSTLFRVFVYAGLLCCLWHVFKPLRIRTRLRWAFLLNFLIPFSLLLMLSGFAVVFLVGGYNAAVAQRIIGQYGVYAAIRAENLYDAYLNQKTVVGENVPFTSSTLIRLPDEPDIVRGDMVPEISQLLNHERRRLVEYVAVERDDIWEFWVSGYYHHNAGTGAVVAYRIDQTMLNRLRDVMGFEAMLVRGQSFPWITAMPKDVPYYQSDGIDRISKEHRLFNIGAAMFYKPAERNALELSATLRILATKDMLLNALMLSELRTSELDSVTPQSQMHTTFGSIQADTFDLESINVFNAFLFVLLAGMFGVLLALVILSLSTSFLISRRINRSVKVLKDGTTALDSGNLDYRIPIVSSDELGGLASDFNQMAENLSNYTAEREKLLLEQVEKERLQETFETARLLQQSLLPEGSIDNHPALEVAADFRPMDTVGGDYYDYLWFRDNGLGLVIGDVSGHGMPAGLMMAMAKSCLVNQVRTSPGIYDVMSAVNNMILESFQSKRIMTFQYAVFTPDGSRMRFASAGHQFPYLYNASDESLHELESIAYPLGVRHTLAIDIKEVTLEPGDAVILFTDGLVEAVNPDGEQLGYDRLQDIFREVAHLSAHDAVQRVMYRIDQFRNGSAQVDDITLVVVRRRGSDEIVSEES
jgi:serine phosphatase RsbU (regulator of sigma subunit)